MILYRYKLRLPFLQLAFSTFTHVCNIETSKLMALFSNKFDLWAFYLWEANSIVS